MNWICVSCGVLHLLYNKPVWIETFKNIGVVFQSGTTLWLLTSVRNNTDYILFVPLAGECYMLVSKWTMCFEGKKQAKEQVWQRRTSDDSGHLENFMSCGVILVCRGLYTYLSKVGGKVVGKTMAKRVWCLFDKEGDRFEVLNFLSYFPRS